MKRYLTTLLLLTLVIFSNCHILEFFGVKKAVETLSEKENEDDDFEPPTVASHNCACDARDPRSTVEYCLCTWWGACSSEGDHMCCKHEAHNNPKVCDKIGSTGNPPMPGPKPTPSPIPVPICPDREQHCKEKESCAVDGSMKCCKVCHNHCI